MKKFSIYALMGAIALTGAVGFSSCSSEDDVIDNPDYNPETNSVKTEFTISLPNYVGSSTRQEDAIVQVSGAAFRGMQNMVLIPFNGTAITPLNNKIFTLSDITAFDLSKQQAKVYKELDVPLGTSRFIFYGQAKVTGDDFKNGKLNAPSFALNEGVAPASGNYNFTLEKIQPDYDKSTYEDTRGKAICAYIEAIRETSGITSTLLQSLLTNFKPIAASSASIQAAVQQLWDQVKTYTTEDGKDKVKDNILGSGNSTATISDGNVVELTGSDITGYPENLNLPDGAVSIDWSDIANPKINTGETLNAAAITKYVYPAALYYRANSNIGVSQNENVSTTYGDDTWATIASSDKYTWNGSVSASTHSIALKDQIQYAVGRLDLSVKAEAATLADREGKTITVAETGFPISAVLIGGQKDVNYEFKPSGTQSYTIYDKVMNGTVAAKGGAVDGVNRTLVLETATDAKTVNVAVEMTNNTGTAFRGVDGTVPAGGKFYLVGTLNLDAPSGITNPRTKIFEQDYITTAVFTIKKGTFKETPVPDTNTNGLGAAYNVIPDLTVSQLEVAFSVNLEWTPGITFEVDL
jgi:hypothetical protein